MQGETTGLNRVAREERTSLCSSSLNHHHESFEEYEILAL
ncbi:Uncharacterised protein [Vibrio cholerae]|nr:Uncharacterised protein [Vibrio cholerae]CSD26980.1 Uncharacterised protein [Vibrio cholerae]